jgi:hypothetical protein
MRRTTFTALAALVGLLIAAPAHATALPPGGSVAPGVIANPLTAPGNTILASIINGTGTATGANGQVMSVMYSAWVVRVGTGGAALDTGGPQAPGQLDFVYQFTNTSPSLTGTPPGTIVNSTSHASFGGFGVGVDYTVTGAGQSAPNAGTRSVSPGSAVNFLFNAVGGVPPGGMSTLETIETNAVNFTTGNYTFQDGVTVQVAAFQPAPSPPPVPEPSTMALATLGTLGLVGYALRRKARRA